MGYEAYLSDSRSTRAHPQSIFKSSSATVIRVAAHVSINAGLTVSFFRPLTCSWPGNILSSTSHDSSPRLTLPRRAQSPGALAARQQSRKSKLIDVYQLLLLIVDCAIRHCCACQNCPGPVCSIKQDCARQVYARQVCPGQVCSVKICTY